MKLCHSITNCTRFIIAGVKKWQWAPYIQEVYRILKPGNGWIQCCEFCLLRCDDGSVPPDAAVWRFDSYYSRFTNCRLNDMQNKRFHDHFLSGDHLEKIIRDAGFVDVNVRTT